MKNIKNSENENKLRKLYEDLSLGVKIDCFEGHELQWLDIDIWLMDIRKIIKTALGGI